MALCCGNREGGILTYDLACEARDVDPFVSNGLEESGESGTAKGTVMG